MRLTQPRRNSIFLGGGEGETQQPSVPTAVKQRGAEQPGGHPRTHPPGGLGSAARPNRFRKAQ